mgnify:CR=1 FL=1
MLRSVAALSLLVATVRADAGYSRAAVLHGTPLASARRLSHRAVGPRRGVVPRRRARGGRAVLRARGRGDNGRQQEGPLEEVRRALHVHWIYLTESTWRYLGAGFLVNILKNDYSL